jgi:hypothetical protein
MVVLVIGITAALGVVARGVGMFVLGQPAAPLAAQQRHMHHLDSTMQGG